MKCLSIRQPWAGLIALGIKKIENRSRRTNYRGAFGIHAGVQTCAEIEDMLDGSGQWFVPGTRFDPLMGRLPDRVPDRERVRDRVQEDGFADWRAHPAFRTGAIVGVAVLDGCSSRPATLADAQREFFGQPGMFWWRVRDAAHLPTPIPCKGRLSWFAPEAEVGRELALLIEDR